MPGEEEIVEETEEEEGGEEEEEGLEYTTDTPLGGSYMTPPSTGGCLSPSSILSHLPTPRDSNPESNAALCTEELEAHIKTFLEEAEEDLEMDNLPPVENSSPLPVPAPVFPGFVPFAVSTGQHCIPPKSLLRKVYVRATLPPSMLFADRALCHRYDFLVRLIGTDLTFLNFLNFYSSLGIDHNPPCSLCSHDLCLFYFLISYSSHDHMAKRSHYRIMIFSTLEYY